MPGLAIAANSLPGCHFIKTLAQPLQTTRFEFCRAEIQQPIAEPLALDLVNAANSLRPVTNSHCVQDCPAGNRIFNPFNLYIQVEFGSNEQFPVCRRPNPARQDNHQQRRQHAEHQKCPTADLS